MAENWFPLLQSIGIIAGLLFTAISIRRDTRARRVSDFLTLTSQHRELWSELHQRPDLHRILREDVDLVANPITVPEREFLNLAIVHFHTGWLLTKEGAMSKMESVRTDIAFFFSLPLPRTIWNETKIARDQEFQKFVDSCLK